MVILQKLDAIKIASGESDISFINTQTTDGIKIAVSSLKHQAILQ